ncbi:MAG: 5-methyltetrahydropteroyltriglutamate--homocysteine S-methyltransferase [Rhodospirillaceae bacterium]|jgi:5-methyltetrahydropteroyltriglutamate--homocysteine methyltransferase|nr:5-methyltetrahydropteroyltriglutamate--homocysteine S-methyltransferase [Rhodospirillaceae bacterium]MBT4589779.1 5-methyltetrahydropteroyltriglutamate--homocysteine S-methyltransferase [Rhodospirillaceae bacterium]MBT5939990.1 5-methyltetrahydropteroyltriglutamate--homocysteine S-methyltransferase [Rhodospirillaceae bacterium]MBT7266255.1 5-methyltetrahydropteroyltriglutamate--homocysteine S-methyltransferase [Rhodospirillaceae bacterium]
MTKPPYRAEHVGSFIRPDKLLNAARANKAGDLDDAAFEAMKDECIADIVAFQDSIGMPSVTDGEFRRRVWSGGVSDALEGMGVKDGGTLTFKGEEGDVLMPPSPYAEGKLSRKHNIVTDDFKYVSSLNPSGQPKVTMASPPVMHFFLGHESYNPDVYSSDEEYFADLTKAYSDEVAELAAAGCTYIQLDDTALPCNCDTEARETIRARGEDPDELTDTYVKAINSAVGGRPDNMFAGMHMCRGNLKGLWMAEGGYDPIAEKIFNELKIDAFFMEYDNERSGGFEPLRHLPAGKTAVLGLISTKTPELEDKDGLKRRIDEASKFAPLEQLAISPQCGFSSGGGGGQVVTEDDTKRKLELVVEVAQDVWGSI